MGYYTNPGDNNLYMIRHIASQTGSTPIHLNKESIKGLRNLHNLVHNEDVGHDFSKLNTLFAQPNISVYLKGQIEQKKANGGIINDYINTLKHNGSEENSELSLAPNELIKFLDDSGYPYMVNPHTGHKEYHLGKMFDGLNNIFKPIKDSMITREHHGWGDMIGGLGSTAYNAASTLGNAAYEAGKYAAPIVGSAASTAYDAAKYAAPIVGSAAYNAAQYAAPIVGSAASTLGNAAYETGSILGKATGLTRAASDIKDTAYNAAQYAPPIVGSAASTLGNAAYEAGKYAAPMVGNATSALGDAAYNAGSTLATAASQPNLVQNVMRGVAGPIGGVVGGLAGQYAGQKVGQKLSEGIPLIGPFIGPLAGNIAGNLAYNVGAYKGRNKGIELADNLYNYLGGNSNAAPKPNSTSYFPTLSEFGNAAYNA